MHQIILFLQTFNTKAVSFFTLSTSMTTLYYQNYFYYIHFQANALGKGINPFIPPAMGYIASLLFFGKNSFGIKYPIEVEMPLSKDTNLKLFILNINEYIDMFTQIFHSLLVFHTTFNWWSFTGVWVTASLFRSPFFLWSPVPQVSFLSLYDLMVCRIFLKIHYYWDHW